MTTLPPESLSPESLSPESLSPESLSPEPVSAIPTPRSAARSGPRLRRPLDGEADLQRVLRLTNLITWPTLCLHTYVTPFSRVDLLPGELVPWVVCMVLFGVLFTVSTFCPATPSGRRTVVWLAAAETLLALTGNFLVNGSSILAGLLLLVAAQIGAVLPLRAILPWIIGQSLCLLSILLTNWHNTEAWAFGTGYFCFQLFAVTTTQTAVREIQARQKLALVVEELRATRALLGEASRQAERLHISRELHDVVGHHLTALSMNLQVALHVDPGEAARPHLERAEEVTRNLLRDVRATVRGMRETSSCDFQGDVARILQASALHVHMEVQEGFHLTCPIQTQVMLRTVQEIVTNAGRHAHATDLWLRFERRAEELTLYAWDNGRGTSQLKKGCGLSGMQERLESLGGTLTLLTGAGHGLELCATLPMRGTTL